MNAVRRLASALNVAGLVLAWLLIFGYFSLKKGATFYGSYNLVLLARQTTIVAMAALGMTLIIVSGGIDLSVGSVVALVTVAIAASLKAGHGPWMSLLIGLVAGVVSGLLNGLLITRLKVGPFIVTLGTLLVVRGAAKGIANEQKIDAPDTWLNNLLATLSKDEAWKIVPTGVWLMLALAVVVAFVLKRTRFGRHVVAVGSNEAAARLCGVPVERVRLGVYVLGGLFFALAGLMQFSRLTVGDPTVASGLELDVIAAVVIGGASLAGGQGSILGALLGALIMSTIKAGCAQLGISNWVQEIVTGSIIVAAVALDRLRVKSGS